MVEIMVLLGNVREINPDSEKSEWKIEWNGDETLVWAFKTVIADGQLTSRPERDPPGRVVRSKTFGSEWGYVIQKKPSKTWLR